MSSKDKPSVFANLHFAELSAEEKHAMIDEAAVHYDRFLRALKVDTDNDPNSRDTGRRVAKMYVEEFMEGRFTAPPAFTSFPNDQGLNDLISVGPIHFTSLCSHHNLPVSGYGYIGILPGEKNNEKVRLPGLSKYARILEWQAAKPNLQEELTKQILDNIVEVTGASGVAVVLDAKHGCMCYRGVKNVNSIMRTASLTGDFLVTPALKEEFYQFISDNRLKP